MRIPIELTEPQAAVLVLLNREVGDLDSAARYVLQKNQELYQRLG